jgi:hypothetical protein
VELSVWFIYKPEKLIGGFITEVRERRSQKSKNRALFLSLRKREERESQ